MCSLSKRQGYHLCEVILGKAMNWDKIICGAGLGRVWDIQNHPWAVREKVWDTYTKLRSTSSSRFVRATSAKSLLWPLFLEECWCSPPVGAQLWFPEALQFQESCQGLLKESRAGLEKCRSSADVRTDMMCSIFCCDCQQRNGVESSCVAFVSPNPSYLLHFCSCAFSSSTSCSPITNSLFLAPTDRDEFIPPIAFWHLVHILLLFSLFLSYLWINLPQIFV